MAAPLLLPGAEPFFFPGGPAGCLLVHGFTASPQEMNGLGEFLAGRGHTVLGVRLPGHGTSPKDMARIHWHEWLAEVESGYHLLRPLAKYIFAIGLSMGGALSLILAAQHAVDGVVAMSVPHHLPPDRRLPFIRLIAPFQPYLPKGPPDWADREAFEQRVAYDQTPTLSALQLRSVLEKMNRGLPSITAPARLIYSRKDPTVRVEEKHLDLIYANLGSQRKEVFWVENSGHVITSDKDRQYVWQLVAEFIEKITLEAS